MFFVPPLHCKLNSTRGFQFSARKKVQQVSVLCISNFFLNSLYYLVFKTGNRSLHDQPFLSLFLTDPFMCLIMTRRKPQQICQTTYIKFLFVIKQAVLGLLTIIYDNQSVQRLSVHSSFLVD